MFKITIPGDPIAQKRHRHRKLKNGNISTYNPCAREKFIVRHEIEKVLNANYPDFKLLTFPQVTILFYMSIPLSFCKRDRELCEKEQFKHIVKPDIDNLLKFYLDCMAGLLFKDDTEVSIGGAIKIYSSFPRVEIYLKPQSRLVEVDKSCDALYSALNCDELHTATIDVPPCSECYFYKDSPLLRDMSSAR